MDATVQPVRPIAMTPLLQTRTAPPQRAHFLPAVSP